MNQNIKLLSPILFLLCFFVPGNQSFAISIITPSAITSGVSDNIPAKYSNAGEFVKLSASDFSRLSGVKLNFVQRLCFVITKARLKHDLKKNPGLKITEYHNIGEKNKKFNFLWFILGLAGPAIGVATGSLILFGIVAITTIVSAYITKDKSKIKSAWLGLGIGILLFLIVLISAIVALKSF
ncbi:MAG: hypothetical protein ABIR31_07625 [Ginsengibacter sp.]